MKRISAVILFVCLVAGSTVIVPAQLTPEQRAADLVQLANLYARNYGPYEWKRDVIHFDLLNLRPWLDRAAVATNDLDYLDLLVEYVASLNDAHSQVTIPSTFSASLGFSVDIYDGKFLIDRVSRGQLPSSLFPFTIGDELISIDGQSTQDMVTRFAKYGTLANPRSTARYAASLFTSRFQIIDPHAPLIGATSTAVIRRAGGALETYVIPWATVGVPLTKIGPLDTPRLEEHQRESGAIDDDLLPEYMQPLKPLLNMRIPAERSKAVLGWGSRTPIFAMPDGFVQRLGRVSSDVFFSGTFQAEEMRLGFIRIPDFAPASSSTALRQFETEIAYFQANTDGLIIDDMRNPGGSLLYLEAILQRVIPKPFRTMPLEIRATAAWLYNFASTYTNALFGGAPTSILAALKANLDEVQSAYLEGRRLTRPIALNSIGSLTLPPATDATGKVIAYSKPIMVLVDEFSASAGDAFAAVIQDNHRGILLGHRTMGAGGSVVDFDSTSLTETISSVTVSMMSRKDPIVTPDYPTAHYVENIGVRPEITEDYMTAANLLTNGQPYVSKFSRVMAQYIRCGVLTRNIPYFRPCILF